MINLSSFSYVLAAVLFILGIKKLSHPKTARDGNFLAAFGMLIAIVATLFFYSEVNYQYIIAGMIIGAIIGATFAIKVEMTQMPQMVAIFNGFGGGASALIASAEFLESKEKKVLYAIHPVAGRMPGHMNVLLAEANIPYEQLKDLDEINSEFEDCDVALVLGANDVVNPSARHDKSSPIYGMPILDVDKSRTVIINKRTMNTGFAGIQNELFGFDNSIMVFGDAKDMLQQLLKDLKDL